MAFQSVVTRINFQVAARNGVPFVIAPIPSSLFGIPVFRETLLRTYAESGGWQGAHFSFYHTGAPLLVLIAHPEPRPRA